MAGNRPDSGDVHVNALLTNLSIAYKNDSYIADKVFPLIGVNKQSDIVPRYDKAHWFRDEMALRAPGTKAAESGWSVDNTMTYFCDSFALRKIIPDEVKANADAPYDMDRDAVAYVTDKAMMKRETKFAAAVNAASIWTTNTTVGTKWSDFANSDPINDIFTGNRTVQQLIGRKCNTLVLGQIVFDRLRLHPDFLELVKYTSFMNVPTADQMGKALGIEKIFVAEPIYESAVEGANSSMLPIWDDDAVLLYVPAAPSLLSPAAGYTFYWKPLAGGGAQYIRRYRLDEEGADVVEARSYFHVKVTSADAGVRWADCVD